MSVAPADVKLSTALALSARAAPTHGSVVIASLNRPHGITGVHTHTWALHDGLKNSGFACDVIGPFSGSKLWFPIFAVRPIILQHLSPTCATLWHRQWHEAALRQNLTAHLKNRPAKMVIAQCPVSARAAMIVRDQLGAGCRVVMVCHFNHSEAQEYRESGDLPGRRAYQRMLDFEQRVMSEVDQVIYVSHWAQRIVEEERKIQTKSSAVVHNGIPDLPRNASVTRSAFGLRDDDLVLINVGTLEPRKNQVGLVRLFAEISRLQPHAKLLLIGDGSHRAEIEREIQSRGLAQSVKLLGVRRDVPDLLQISDLYLHYATLENCPVVLLECARAGLPFAAIPTGGIPELQRQLNVNIPLDPTNIDLSIAALWPLLSDAEHRKLLGRRARNGFLESFTTEAMVRGYLSALQLGGSR